MNAYITLTYQNGAPCILRTDRIIRKREMPGGTTEIIYGHNEKFIVRESLLDVHSRIEHAEIKKHEADKALERMKALKAAAASTEWQESEPGMEENPSDADRGTETPLESTLTIDRIDLATAIEVPFWRAVWASEPSRQINVRMTYEDLKIICDMAEELANRSSATEDSKREKEIGRC